MDRVADSLCLGAAPMFGIMAVISGVSGAHAAPFCGALHDGVAQGGMTWMYALMGIVHLVPWIRLLANARQSVRKQTAGV
jgi:hypothetical protein